MTYAPEIKLRVRRLDDHNWVLERETPGGKPYRAGGKEGVSKARWDITGYYPSLERAARACLTEAVVAGHTGQDILDRLARAEVAILAALKESPGRDRLEIEVGSL